MENVLASIFSVPEFIVPSCLIIISSGFLSQILIWRLDDRPVSNLKIKRKEFVKMVFATHASSMEEKLKDWHDQNRRQMAMIYLQYRW